MEEHQIKSFIKDKVAEIKKDKKKEFQVIVRDFIRGFGFERRSNGNQLIMDNYLGKHHLETIPSYTEVWIDSEITLKHKETAKSKANSKPTLMVRILPAANIAPKTVSRDSSLAEATTLMLLNQYSQLPVMNGRKVEGVVSWETIGQKKINDVNTDSVKDYLDRSPVVFKLEDSLLDVIQAVRAKGVVLIKAQDDSLSGLLTMSDVNSQLLLLTEPFLLLSQIEHLIRALLNDKFLVEDLQKVSVGAHSIDDLSFGEYIRLIESDVGWSKLGLNLSKCHCVSRLHEVRVIRNDVMHFNADGITAESKDLLVKMVQFLTEVQET